MLILKGFFCQINGCFSRGDGPLELPTLPFSFHPVICGKNHKQRHWVVKFYFREYSMHCQSPATPISRAKAVIQGRSPQTNGRRICRGASSKGDWPILNMSSDLGRDCSVEQQMAVNLAMTTCSPHEQGMKSKLRVKGNSQPQHPGDQTISLPDLTL